MFEEERSLRSRHLNSLSRVAVVNPPTAGVGGSKAERLEDLVSRLNLMGEAHLDGKQFSSALDCFESALYIDPDNRQAQGGRNRALCTIIPRWHFEMLNDEQRNAAFERALTKVITPDTRVLDIGSGTGLLAMMAARAGARETVSCEMVPLLADLAREVVARNGYAGRVRIMGKKSTELTVGDDLHERANLLVTETVDCGLLGEGIVPSLTHARAHLLTEDARVIPRAAQVYAMVVESQRLRGLNSVSWCAGFDVGLFQEYKALNYLPVRLAAFEYAPLTEPFEVFSFDFERGLIRPARRTLRVPVVRDGACHAVVFWFDMHLDEEISITNEPGSTTHWEQAVQCLESGRRVRAGEVLEVEAEHDCCSIVFAEPTSAPAGAVGAG